MIQPADYFMAVLILYNHEVTLKSLKIKYQNILLIGEHLTVRAPKPKLKKTHGSPSSRKKKKKGNKLI